MEPAIEVMPEVVAPRRVSGTRIEVGAVLNNDCAERLARQLALLPRPSTVILDFSRTSEVQDSALGTLLVVLTTLERTCVAVGLTEHHRRVLQYLGHAKTLGC
jgi:hypothetical protein